MILVMSALLRARSRGLNFEDERRAKLRRRFIILSVSVSSLPKIHLLFFGGAALPEGEHRGNACVMTYMPLRWV